MKTKPPTRLPETNRNDCWIFSGWEEVARAVGAVAMVWSRVTLSAFNHCEQYTQYIEKHSSIKTASAIA